MRGFCALLIVAFACVGSVLADRPPTSDELDAWNMIYIQLQGKFDSMNAAVNGAGSTIAMGYAQIDEHEFIDPEYSNAFRRGQLAAIYADHATQSMEVVDNFDILLAVTCDTNSYDSLSNSMGDMIELGAECDADALAMAELAAQANAVIDGEMSDWNDWNSWW